MKVIDLGLPGLKVFTPRVFTDDRGYFFESFRASWLPGFDFVQDNESRSTRSTLRGLHYQLEKPQGKLVRVVEGAVYDVAVDLRRTSTHFGRWEGRLLSDENKEILWVPPGFAHGFLVLSDAAQFVYKCTDYYNPGDERCIQWNDPDLAIEWPSEALPPKVSDKDNAAGRFRDAETFE